MINVFISHATPHNQVQKDFIKLIEMQLLEFNLNPVNLGKSNWSFKSPLTPIKELMQTCKAALIVGFERYHDYIGYSKQNSENQSEYFHKYTCSSWIQIEAGMAYMAGLPLLILKEDKLFSEGILDSNVSEFFVFEFKMEQQSHMLSSELQSFTKSWIEHVHKL